jgi:drug/metabolite transporter (DMT)-like permease
MDGVDMPTRHPDDVSQWWASRRRHYNTVVTATGVICFVLYLALGRGLPNVEVTMFTLGFQLVAGALYLLVANIAYSLGAVVERRLHPNDAPRFRSTLLRLGMALTVAPFVAVPVLLIFRRVAGT